MIFNFFYIYALLLSYKYRKESDHQVVAMEQTKNGETWKVLFTRPILMPMLIGLTLLLIQQVSGIDAVIFFTVDIFRASG